MTPDPRREILEALVADDLSVGEALTALRLPATNAHKPGDPHQYKLTCEVCGDRGTIRITVDPEIAFTRDSNGVPHRCNCPENGTSGSCPFHDSSTIR